jgi:hypothetical protein
VHAEVLPARVDPLERTEPWLDRLLADRPPAQTRLIRPFAQWAVLRPARRAALRGRYSQDSAQRDRDKIRTAVRLLDWLETQQPTVAELTQPQLDAWLASHPTLRSSTVCFTAWTTARRLTVPLIRVAVGLLGDGSAFSTPTTTSRSSAGSSPPRTAACHLTCASPAGSSCSTAPRPPTSTG